MEDFVIAFPKTVAMLILGMGGTIIALVGYFGKRHLTELEGIKTLLGREVRSIRRWMAHSDSRHTRVETVLGLDPLPGPPPERDGDD